MNDFLKLLVTCLLLLSVGAGCKRIEVSDARRMPDQQLFARISKLHAAKQRKGLNARNEENYRALLAVARERYPLWKPGSQDLPYLHPEKYQTAGTKRQSSPPRTVVRGSSKAPLGAGEGAVHDDPRRY